MKTSLKEKKILMQELIGTKVRVIDSTDPSMKNLEGIIIYETKNMLIISELSSQKIIKVPKSIGTFHITLKNGIKFRVKGTRLISRPEDRLKKIKKSR